MFVMTQPDEARMVDATTSGSFPIDNTSDYGDFGSDADEIEILDALLAQVASDADADADVDTDTANLQDQNHNHSHNASLIVTDIEDYEPPRGILVPKTLVPTHSASQIDHEAEIEIEILRNIQTKSADTTKRSKTPDKAPSSPPPDDHRSPLEKFRTPPKKALSVTDLVSPAWCELQYFYVLSKHGRKKRTPAMRQGSAVHKALEDEVHTTVPVETTTIEDSWGLRIWNICQGLQTLRDTGRTRELEIWGTIGGELVNGIIDELSYECPDPKYEENLKAKGIPETDLPEYQTSITEYLLAKPKKNASQEQPMKSPQNNEWIYLTDVKTRATPTLPTGSSLRPTIVQLHLYHHMLENLVQGNFRLANLTERYNLNAHEPFSDSFLAQLGSLNQDLDLNSSNGTQDEATTITASQDSMDVLLQHNNLTSLWEYMMQQFRITFLLDEKPANQMRAPGELFPPPSSQQSTSNLPPPPPQPTRLSPLLTASYMSSSYKRPPSAPRENPILGYKSFQFNSAFLHAYLSESLSWWRGERDAKGVALQEAWKCRSCDFRSDCSWILERDQLAFDEAMKRKKMREMAGVQDQSSMKRSNV